jgi:histidine triad (HIT) family protein
MSETNCIFCSIITKKIPATIIAENDDVIVIKDIAPKAPIHYLVIPKLHVADLLAPQVPGLMESMIKSVQELCAQKLIPTSFRTIINTGAGSGQIIFHLHMHLLAGKAMSDF